jgi:heptosyltransferase II
LNEVSEISCRPWKEFGPPKKILAIRFQALGDTIITLPYLNDLRNRYSSAELHFLTRKEVAAVPRHLNLFEKVFEIGGGRNVKVQFILALLILPRLWFERYDVVLDLQNHRFSKIIRALLLPRSFAQFDRSSPISAGDRTRLTIDACGLGPSGMKTDFVFKSRFHYSHFSPNKETMYVILNPAGYCASRNWPIENYITFAQTWKERYRKTKFILLLMPSLSRKSAEIAAALGENVIDLTGKADQTQAFWIISQCHLMVTEDSGLMHMAWTQGIPTVALFSSSRKDWSAPQGPRSVCLDSSDLECGPCGLEVCKFGTNHCITRYTPSKVVELASSLVVK